MNKDELIQRYILGKEQQFTELYILQGPAKLREVLGVNLEEWIVIFDHMVFENNLIYKCVIATPEFFTELYVKHGISRVRDILDIVDKKYDQSMELIFDFLAIVNGGLYKHVMQFKGKYANALRRHGSDFVKKVLGLNKEKYIEHWSKVLDFLLNVYNEQLMTGYTFDRGLASFSQMMNSVRVHRKPFQSGLFI